MTARSYPPSFPLRLALEDARLIEEAGAAHGVDPPLCRTVAERFQQALDAGHGDEGMASVVAVMRRDRSG